MIQNQKKCMYAETCPTEATTTVELKTAFKPEPIAQVLGTAYFTLLEVIPKKSLQILEKVYIGKEQREQVDRIKRRVEYKELTNNAQQELEHAVEQIIRENPQKFLYYVMDFLS